MVQHALHRVIIKVKKQAKQKQKHVDSPPTKKHICEQPRFDLHCPPASDPYEITPLDQVCSTR